MRRAAGGGRGGRAVAGGARGVVGGADVGLGRALGSGTLGRPTLTVADRLSTAEAADEVLVGDKGVVVQRGPHHELVAVPGIYADLHASWVAQSR